MKIVDFWEHFQDESHLSGWTSATVTSQSTKNSPWWTRQWLRSSSRPRCRRAHLKMVESTLGKSLPEELKKIETGMNGFFLLKWILLNLFSLL
jgi:hypothetical protein